MDQYPPANHVQGGRPSTWVGAIARRLPLALVESLRRLGLRRGVPLFVLAWLLVLLAIDALYPIDVRGWFISALLILFYLLPAFLAFDQRHRRRVLIGVLNVLLGWTIIGWIGVLLWAMTQGHRATQAPRETEATMLGTDV